MTPLRYHHNPILSPDHPRVRLAHLCLYVETGSPAALRGWLRAGFGWS